MPAGNGLSSARDDARDARRFLLRFLARFARELDQNSREILPGRDFAQKQLAFQVAVGRDPDVILVCLAFVGDAEPPGLGLREFAQSPGERDVTVIGVADDPAKLNRLHRDRFARLGVHGRSMNLISLDRCDLQVQPSRSDVEGFGAEVVI